MLFYNNVLLIIINVQTFAETEIKLQVFCKNLVIRLQAPCKTITEML